MPTPSRSKQMKQMQKSAQRKRVRAQIRHQGTQLSHPNVKETLRSAGGWKIYEVLLTKDWQQPNELVQAIVARRSPSGVIATGVFLIDLGCLGVKQATAGVFGSVPEYEERLRERIIERQPMAEADLNLVAKILREGVAYARSLGFEPDPDYRDAVLILGAADPSKCDVPVHLGGPDGKPFLVAGPYDDARAIIAKLASKCGPDGFHYLAPIDPGGMPGIEQLFNTLEDDEEDEDEDGAE
jgi:hypothetical protein